MKKVVAAAILVAATLQGKAQQLQEHRHHVPGRKGWHIQPQLCAGSAWADGDLYNNNTYNQSVEQGKDKPYFSGGFHAGYMFNNHLGLYGGINYTSFTWQSKISDYSAGDYFVANITQGYVQVPVYLRYISSRPGKIGFLGTFGPRISFLTNEKETDIAYGTTQTTHDKSYYNSSLVALGLGLGVNIPCTRNIWLDLLLDSQVTSSIFKDNVATDQRISGGGILAGLDVAL